jgi:hypothetical protein
MDALHLSIALGPVCVYLFLIGSLNLSRFAFVTNGTRDFLALSLATFGLVAVGPIELFMPEASAAYFRGWIWGPIFILYLLVAVLIAMVSKPRIVVYNVTLDQLRPVLDRVASELDSEYRWAGDSLAIPNLGIQLFLQQSYPGTRNIQLVAAGGEPNLNQWKRLEVELRQALSILEVGSNPRGFSFITVALILLCAIGYALFSGRAMLAERVQDFLRM